MADESHTTQTTTDEDTNSELIDSIVTYSTDAGDSSSDSTIFPSIARKTMDRSTININSLLIKDPQETNFKTDLAGNVTNGGAFQVRVDFPDPITVYYKGGPLGTMNMNGVNIKNGNGQMSANESTFAISDPSNLIAFTADLLTSESVDWELKGKVKIQLQSLHLSKTLPLDKIVTLKGANGFQDTVIKNLTITQNNATNTLDLFVTAVLQNPSPVGMELGVLGLQVYYNSTLVASVTTDSFTLLPGENTINMRGSVTPPQTDNDKANIAGFVTSYIQGQGGSALAKGVSATPSSGAPISWLNTIVQGLQLNAKLASATPFKVITGVDFGQMKLVFTNDSAYAPIASSNRSIADYVLPFDISLQVTEVSQDIKIYTQDQLEIASLTSGFGPATNDASRIFIDIPATPLTAEQTDAGEQIFQDFLKNLTLGSALDFQIVGTSNVVANTVIGNLTLTGIPLNTTTTINGFQGLGVKAPVISNLNLIGGTKDGLVMGLNVDLFNPTNFSLDAGSVDFEMFLDNQTVGFAHVANLLLTPADSNLTVTATLDPKNNPSAQKVLNSFLNGTQATIEIGGYEGSTTIASLTSAFTSLRISSALPPLTTKLLGKTSLGILPDTAKNGVAKASVDLINPFAADLSISSIQSTLGFHGKQLATMNINNLPTPIVAAGNKTTEITGLPVTLNLDPTFLFNVVRISAKEAGLDLTPIDVLLTLGGITGIEDFKPIDLKSVDPSIFKNFNMIDYTKQALNAMTVDVNMKSTITVGEYTFEMSYVQFGVATSTDDSISLLISALSTPIVQKVVDGSNISFSKIFIENPSETAFTADISGEIDDSGPFDATISFGNGATLSSNNVEFGKMVLPDIKAVEGKAVLNIQQSPFQITNAQALAGFTDQILTSKSASWTMAANNITVSALDLSIPNINLSKTIDLAGANGFLNDIKVVSFSLPGTTPEGGMAVSVQVNLKNEAVVGVDLGTVNFNMFFDETFIGPIAATNATFLPSTTVPLTLNGQILPPTSPKTSAALEKLFKLFLAGEPVPFQNVGDSVVTKNGPVSWLNEPIKKISITLPIQGPKLTDESVITLDTAIITHITASSFNVKMAGEIAKTGPFAATLNYPDGVDVLYDGGVIGNTKMTPISVQPNVTAKIDQDAFFAVKDINGLAKFTGDLLKQPSVSWELKTDTMVIEVGKVPIAGIPFDKQVPLIGFNGLKDGIKINNIEYGKGGDGKGLPFTIDSTLINPSNVGIELGTIVFDTSVEGTPVSPITGNNVLLAPKANTNITFTGEITDFSVIEKILEIISSGKQPLLKIVGKSVDPPNAGGPVPWLQIPFSQLSIELPFPVTGLPPIGNKTAGLNSLTLNFDAKSFAAEKSSTISASVTNQFPVDIVVHGVEATANIGGNNLGSISVSDLPKEPTIKAGQTTELTMPFSFGAGADLVGMQKLASQPADSLAFDITLTAKVSIGNYPTSLDFKQNAVPLKITGASDLFKSPSNTATPTAKNNTNNLVARTKGLPPPAKIDTKGLPPPPVNIDTKGLPPPPVNIDTKGLPPPPANIDTKGLPPPPVNIDTKGLPPPPVNIDTKGLPPPPVNIDTKGLPPPPVKRFRRSVAYQ
ncbi:14912_t:CDS:2 [Entrophospora sp. SA101]|nr:12545_t:CDS:2 [Entrophospora sp. SA101]CAJ0750031.1 7781_t:CDS:2 [Entrophospora sp. SA101]CAJ0753618.1 14912_t:CDS:2 [Entrophospora sp. SA101]CAJ0902501.1 8389_t:CDS:2 [Entrophospora sp. SA101]CAJ0902520.1 8392_t:CDS:2 [Entrophospora sp. SA101]